MSPAILDVRERIRRFAHRPHPVLVTGESGAGKEIVARLLHAMSGRSGDFVAVNVGGALESLFDSELFGHSRGAFTGADRESPGHFESARDGTLFLDEIGDLPPALQTRLLRVLEVGHIRRVGGELRPVTARVVVATNVDLDAAVRTGRFRLDLLYRLAVLRIHVPPLSARREDIPALARHLAAAEGAIIEPTAIAWLARQQYPGNVRQLRNVLIRAVAENGPLIDRASIAVSYRVGIDWRRATKRSKA